MTVTSFPPEAMERAKKRKVHDLYDGGWIVEGDTRLGDAYESYVVRFDSTTKRYFCPCYKHRGGDVRSSKICSHVKAVILHRARRRVVAQAKARVAAKQDLAAGGSSSAQASPPAATPLSVPSPTDSRFGSTPLPPWVGSFRGPQWQAVTEIVDAFNRGAKYVFLNAPTGTGKSLIADLVRRELQMGALYVATTKHLQDQLAKDFPYASVLKGRNNYIPTEAWGEVTCGDCTKTAESKSCRWCPSIPACPYQIAKAGALSSSLAVLNTSYFLTEANGPGRFSKKGQRGLVVLDEADLLERELMSHVEVRLSPRRQKELGINPPSRKTVESAWGEWVTNEAIPKVEQGMADLGPLANLTEARDIRRAKSLDRLRTGLHRLEEGLPDGGWIYDYASGRDSDIAFKPVRVDKYGPDKLWGHGGKFLLMSATIISASQMADDLGIEGEWETVDVPMGFAKENRPVRVVSVAEMTRNTEDTAKPIMAEAIVNIINRHPGERVLVHTVSYALASYISAELKMRIGDRVIVTYTNGKFKDNALKTYLKHEGAVMVAPSMDRGVDLPDDACRVQIIAKVPYPYLGDKQVNARMHSKGGRSWYAVETVRTLVQMCGRGVRSADDHAETYILDSSWTNNLWKNHRALFPQWFKDALDWRFPKHLLTSQ